MVSKLESMMSLSYDDMAYLFKKLFECFICIRINRYEVSPCMYEHKVHIVSSPSASPSYASPCTNTDDTFKIKIGKKKTTTTCDEFESIKKSKQRNSARRILLLRLTLPFAISSALLATMRSSSKDQWQETHVQEESQQ